MHKDKLKKVSIVKHKHSYYNIIVLYRYIFAKKNRFCKLHESFPHLFVVYPKLLKRNSFELIFTLHA